MRNKSSAIFTACLALACALPAAAATLDRIKETGHIKLGYLPDARPFSFKNDAGKPDGYGVALCEAVAAQVKAQLGLSDLTLDWEAVAPETRFSNVQQGSIDLLCTPASVTLTHRKTVSFSLPVFAGGNRAVLRADAPAALRQLLAGARPDRPVWRGSPAAKQLGQASYAVVAGTSTQSWLESRRKALDIGPNVTAVPDYRTGLQLVLDRKVDVFIGERSLVLGAFNDQTRDKLAIVNRLYTNELAGLALARGDDDFRLTVDAALSKLYASKEFAGVYAQWLGEFDDGAQTFFLWNTPGE